MSTLLGVCTDIRQVYHEVDHVMLLAAGHWHQRNGLHGTRHVEMQERLVKVKVGMEDPILPCPEFPGSSGTPPGTPLRTAAGLTPRNKHKAGRGIRLAPLSPPQSARKSNRRTLKDDNSHIEDFFIPDYVLAESQSLLQMYQAIPDCQEIGTIERSAKLFEVVVVLCKLRWLVRLHAALLTFAGPKCSLHRMLLGMLADVCNPDNPHLSSPVQIFELVVQTLEHRFQESWPTFLRYISGIDSETYSKPAGDGNRPISVPQQFANETRMPCNRSDAAQRDRDSAASIWQTVDDIFIAWVVQADATQVAIEAVLQELDHFGIPRPTIRTQLDFLQKWFHAVVEHPSTVMRKQSTLLAVQEQGHHLAAFLELPSVRARTQYAKAELISMSRAIVSHPLTFNVGVRKRLMSTLQGDCRWVGFERMSLKWEVDDESLSSLLAFTTNRADAGSINPKRVQKLKLSAPRAATAWADKREMLQPTWQQPPRSLPFKWCRSSVHS